jgi:pyrroloquinoline quinone biosynthesis protein B
VRIFGDEGVERALLDGYPVLAILERYCGAEWQTLQPERPTPLQGSSLVVELFHVGGDAPRYLAGSDVELEASGFVFRDRAGPGVVTYVPGLARLDNSVLERFATSDLVLVDGTFWRNDELTRLKISNRSAHDMGHVPLSGPGGTLEALARLQRPRKALVHINNTNPILLEDSPERTAVLQAGVEVAYDGLEIEL